MLAASARRIEELVADDAVVLDVGGWAKPFARADWVVDLMPYETRGLYGKAEGVERFDAERWIQRDICARDPLPFEDGQIDFAVCSHTLEDVRDPIWVCAELNRVARAGYIEVPSRLEEQSVGVQGPWAGWSHHRWLVDVTPGRIEFLAKPGVLHGNPDLQLPAELGATLTAEERVATLFWEGGFEFSERVFMEAAELDAHLAELAASGRSRLAGRVPPRRRRLRERIRRTRG